MYNAQSKPTSLGLRHGVVLSYYVHIQLALSLLALQKQATPYTAFPGTCLAQGRPHLFYGILRLRFS